MRLFVPSNSSAHAGVSQAVCAERVEAAGLRAGKDQHALCLRLCSWRLHESTVTSLPLRWAAEATAVRGITRLHFPPAGGLPSAGVSCEDPARASSPSSHFTWVCWSPGSASSSPGCWVWRPSLICCTPDLGSHPEHVGQDLGLGRGLQGKYL